MNLQKTEFLAHASIRTLIVAYGSREIEIFNEAKFVATDSKKNPSNL